MESFWIEQQRERESNFFWGGKLERCMPNSLLGEEVNGEVDAHLLRIGSETYIPIKGPF